VCEEAVAQGEGDAAVIVSLVGLGWTGQGPDWMLAGAVNTKEGDDRLRKLWGTPVEILVRLRQEYPDATFRLRFYAGVLMPPSGKANVATFTEVPVGNEYRQVGTKVDLETETTKSRHIIIVMKMDHSEPEEGVESVPRGMPVFRGHTISGTVTITSGQVPIGLSAESGACGVTARDAGRGTDGFTWRRGGSRISVDSGR